MEQATEFIPDENEQEYPMYQDGFELRNFNEELLPYVNNDKAGMIADMQRHCMKMATMITSMQILMEP